MEDVQMSRKISDIVIGIDLGTIKSSVGVWRNGKPEVFNGNQGRIRSLVYFSAEDRCLVGRLAKRDADYDPENGICDVKRLIGRSYNETIVEKVLSYAPFQVENKDNKPVFIMKTQKETFQKTPQDVYACILEKLKAHAEKKLEHAVDKVVISVPHCFNNLQRQITVAAAKQAGFIDVQLLGELTAVALSYYYDCVYGKSFSDEEVLSLVYDLGGGTFEVAVMSRKGSDIAVKAFDGNMCLGGRELTNLLVEHVGQILIKQYNFNPRANKRDMRRLTSECENVKKSLSSVEEVTIHLTYFLPDNPSAEILITRQEFEDMAKVYFAQTMDIVDRCLKRSHLTPNDIKEVIIAGSAFHIPKIEAMIQEYFGGKNELKFVDPDKGVVEGAAIQAALLSKHPSQFIKGVKVTGDVNIACENKNDPKGNQLDDERFRRFDGIKRDVMKYCARTKSELEQEILLLKDVCGRRDAPLEMVQLKDEIMALCDKIKNLTVDNVP